MPDDTFNPRHVRSLVVQRSRFSSRNGRSSRCADCGLLLDVLPPLAVLNLENLVTLPQEGLWFSHVTPKRSFYLNAPVAREDPDYYGRHV